MEEIDAGTVINDPHPEIKRERLKMEEEERHLQRERDQRDLEARIRNEQN